MLDRLPTTHLITMLTSIAPAEAARLLYALTTDRMAVLVTTMEPARFAPIILAAEPGQADGLLLAMSAEARTSFLRQLSMAQVGALLPMLEPSVAVEVARTFPPRTIAEIVSEQPAPAQRKLRRVLLGDDPMQFGPAIYQRDVVNMLVGVATAVSWLDQATGDLLAEVLGKPVRVAVTYRREPLHAIDVEQCVDRGQWPTVAGIALLTNESVTADAEGRAKALSREGRLFEALRWVDDRDNGTLKRALIRLVG